MKLVTWNQWPGVGPEVKINMPGCADHYYIIGRSIKMLGIIMASVGWGLVTRPCHTVVTNYPGAEWGRWWIQRSVMWGREEITHTNIQYWWVEAIWTMTNDLCLPAEYLTRAWWWYEWYTSSNKSCLIPLSSIESIYRFITILKIYKKLWHRQEK